MDYDSTLNEIYSLAKFGSQLGLERISQLLGALGNPQEKLQCILIAGTNGKGSTVAFTAEILRECGCKVGSYYSPHIVEFRERIQVNGEYISEADVCEMFGGVRAAYEKQGLQPTFFEAVTAMAFGYFAKMKVDFAVLEVGLGGRLDATNLADAKVAVIASIDIEHTEVLGDTVEKIAMEKAGIIKQNSTVIIGEGKHSALGAIMRACREQNAKPSVFGSDFQAVPEDWALGIPGELQRKNAALAIGAANAATGKKIADAKIKSALAKAHIPCRFEKIADSPMTILDAAHNPAAFSNLAAEVAKISAHPKILVFGAMEDKDIFAMLSVAKKSFNAIILNQPSLSRAAKMADVEQMAALVGWKSIYQVAGVRESVAFARNAAGRGGLVVVAGSMYMLGEYFGKDKVIGM